MSATQGRGPHTPEHDNWDQGGYCNALVVDENGDGDICGYRRPPAPLPDKEPAIVRRGGESMRGWALVDDRNSATRMAFRPFDSSGTIILDTTVWTVERLPRKELTPVEMAAFLGAAFPDFPDPHCDHHQTPATDGERDERLQEARALAAEVRANLPRYSKVGRSLVALDDEVTRLTALLAEQAATIERVRAACIEHWDHQARREMRFGREGSGCVCGVCNVMRALAPQPKEASS